MISRAARVQLPGNVCNKYLGKRDRRRFFRTSWSRHDCASVGIAADSGRAFNARVTRRGSGMLHEPDALRFPQNLVAYRSVPYSGVTLVRRHGMKKDERRERPLMRGAFSNNKAGTGERVVRHLLQRAGRSSEIDRASQRAYSHYYLHMTISGLFPPVDIRYMCPGTIALPRVLTESAASYRDLSNGRTACTVSYRTRWFFFFVRDT